LLSNVTSTQVVTAVWHLPLNMLIAVELINVIALVQLGRMSLVVA